MAGTTWITLNKGLATLNVRSLVQSPTDPDCVLCGTNGSGLYRSKNRRRDLGGGADSCFQVQ